MFQERVATHDEAMPGYGEIWSGLEAILLAVGGLAVVPPGNPDPMIRVFRDQGKVQEPSSVLIVPGAAKDCHANAVGLWRARQSTAIGTGYALSGDLWREHSWGWDDEGRLIETTEPRDSYFGVRIEGNSAQRFAEWISPTGERG